MPYLYTDSRVPVLSLDALPDDALLRAWQLEPPVLPFSNATLWRKVRAGTFPKPTKFSDRVTAWRVGEVREWLAAKVTA